MYLSKYVKKKKKKNYIIVSCRSELLALGLNLLMGQVLLSYGLLYVVFGPIRLGVCLLVKGRVLVLLGKVKI